MDALKAYTEGTQRRAAGRETEAIPFFERAIALDSRFALAYTTLSSLYGGLGETGRSEELARLAYENREHVSERERLFITYQYHDRFTGDQTRTQETLEVWKRTYPRDYRPANALAVLFNRLGDYQAAMAEAEEAIKRNPAHAFPQSNLAYALRGAGRFDRAKRRGGAGGRAEPRHRSAAAAPVSALRDAGRSADRACTARVGGDEQRRLRSDRRTRADRGVPRPHDRGAAAVRGNDRRRGRARASRRSDPGMPRRRR